MKLPHDLTDDHHNNVAHNIRQLCIGARPKVQASSFWGDRDREALEHLYCHGYAERHSNGESGKWETYTYVATAKLLDWARQQDVARCTFDQALERIDAKKARAKFAAQRREERRITRAYPSIRDVSHRVIVEAQAPGGVTINEEDEVSGKGLTQWYVDQYCRLNNLRSA